MLTMATILAICLAESNLTNVVNQADPVLPSYGVCQVKLSTAKMISPSATVELLMKPPYNLFIASEYYKRQLRRYGGNHDKAISAYNAGTATRRNLRYVARVKRRLRLILQALPLGKVSI